MWTDYRCQRRVASGNVSGTRTNIFLRSEEADNAYWTKSNCSITANTAIFFNGQQVMDKIVENGALGVHGIIVGAGSLVGSETYTLSCFVRAAERTALVMYSINVAAWGAHFNLLTGATSNFASGGGTVEARGIESWGNGLYRCWVTGSLNNSATTHNIVIAPEAVYGTEIYTGDSVSGIHVCGMMFELSNSLGTYIKSVSTQGTGPGSRSRLMSAHIGAGAAASTVRFRNGSSTGTILAEIDATAGTSGISQPFIAERGGIVFKDGIYTEFNGSPVAVTMNYQV